MLEARNVSFAYPRASRTLYENFSLQVEPGERVALLAPSGFGKTTLCRILAGYEKPQAGEVLVDGARLPERGACPVQLILQHPELALDPRMRMVDSLEEAGGAFAGLRGRVNAGLVLAEETAASGDEAERLLRGLGIRREWLTRFPHELSGGELQRFCVARALAGKPRYLIADEISTMLDALTQAQIWRFLLEEAESCNMGLVFVSHSPALTQRLATREIDLAG
ncbi:MAG: ATP-binding cassette domain-containing protein [Eggerthellaceae bacterium]|nr:ATP-binding cassette domain-containing protein [Eggerthellaceae bacterium]